ncbi:hypothetical protein BCR33DRAFT_448468 [Rhizoclosmatium globosum]|uniref:Uncharacterized protein n=1 Tax=Rhizoclosmatium globosum TaxID=329046 RepID=A0A1Y2BSB2_9FUNG|nr:hypothetical protein BCR33DRAFT_448468 [Rhizoclosmatium globosum]|eukprot:ORY37638.1 hypothetical protein BCR33DRAFT_448468 [Rhizoclosmatium globosum]
MRQNQQVDTATTPTRQNPFSPRSRTPRLQEHILPTNNSFHPLKKPPLQHQSHLPQNGATQPNPLHLPKRKHQHPPYIHPQTRLSSNGKSTQLQQKCRSRKPHLKLNLSRLFGNSLNPFKLNWMHKLHFKKAIHQESPLQSMRNSNQCLLVKTDAFWKRFEFGRLFGLEVLVWVTQCPYTIQRPIQRPCRC